MQYSAGLPTDHRVYAVSFRLFNWVFRCLCGQIFNQVRSWLPPPKSAVSYALIISVSNYTR